MVLSQAGEVKMKYCMDCANYSPINREDVSKLPKANKVRYTGWACKKEFDGKCFRETKVEYKER